MYLLRVLCIVGVFGISTSLSAGTSNNGEKSEACHSVSSQACDIHKMLGRGVNLGGMLEAPQEGQWGVKYDKNFAEIIAQQFNHVRLPVNWSNHASTDSSAKLDEDFARRVDAIINSLLEKNLFIVVNIHGYSQLYGDKVTYGEKVVSETVVEQRFYNLWKQLSARYKKYPNKVIFEILNEPHGKVINSQHWNEMIAKTLELIRVDNPDRIVMFGPTGYNSQRDLAKLKVPNDQNLIIEVHSYEPFHFTHQGIRYMPIELPVGVKCCDEKQTQTINYELNQAHLWSIYTGYPIYLGEFGSYKLADIESRANFARLIRSKSESLNIPWAYWDFSSDSFGLFDTKSNTWNPRLFDALIH